jgi:hypothetical protein
MTLKDILRNGKTRFRTKELRYVVIGGSLDNPENIVISSRFLADGWYEKDPLKKGDLALLNWGNNSKVYRVLKTNNKYSLVQDTEFKIRYSEILVKHREKQARGEIPKRVMDPEGSKIDLVKINEDRKGK